MTNVLIVEDDPAARQGLELAAAGLLPALRAARLSPTQALWSL